MIDVDSTIPNIALMKISQYHKTNGDIVGFNITDPDKVYCSIIFRKNKHKADGLRFIYPNAIIDIGGPGYDLNKRLPEEIEKQTPDYSLYPNNDRYLGFTTRGCIRSCSFCIVRKKEGSFRKIYDDVNSALDNIMGSYKFNQIEFLDNNILADKNWFMKLCEEIIKRNMKVDFNQGLDIRLIDNSVAEMIGKLKPINTFKFAFDSMDYVDSVINGINILKNNGVDTRHKVFFYVYVNDDSQYENAVKRCRILKENGTTPYIMLNQETPHTKRMKNLKRWCRPWVFWSIDINEYTRSNKA